MTIRPKSVSKPELLKWDFAHRRLLYCLSIFFLIVVSLGLHGYSLPIWHNYIDNTRHKEVRSGNAQGIRSDDWALDLPMVIAQAVTSPSFPVNNPNIGDGQNMMMPMQTPVLHPIGLFRPSTWGFVFGVNRGLGWMWWSVLLGLFYGVFLLLQLLTKNQFWWSLWGAAGFCMSPMIQMWSLHKAQIPLHACFLLVGLIHVLFSNKPKIILWNGVLVGWSAGCLAFHYIYPPIQVTFGLLSGVIAAGYILDHWRCLKLKEEIKYRLGAGVIALSIIFFAVASFLISGSEQMNLIMNTTYPGRRFSNGGGMPLEYFFNNYFLILDPPPSWVRWGNICEASFGIFLAPVIFVGQLVMCIQKKRWPSRLSLFLVGFIVFTMWYSIWGFPLWLAEMTMMNRSTSPRVQMALLFADLCLAAVVCAELFEDQIPDLDRKSLWRLDNWKENIWLKTILATIWTGILGYVYSNLVTGKSDYSTLLAVAILGANFILVWIFVGFTRPELFFAGVLIVNFYGTYWFNPVVRGGIDYIRNNPMSAAVLTVDRNHGPGKWAVIHHPSLWPLGNLLRMLGVKTIGGYECGPPLKSLSILDPEGRFARIYNQCAFLTFASESGPGINFTSPSPGQVVANISADNVVFSRLGVDFFLIIGGVEPDPIDLKVFELQTPLPSPYRIYHRKIPSV